ncbi:UTP--glucose-1-phosphate uridylyltransferase [bacterium]|nr:UTP--glucose-1-phosphate uridylyltransferase [candidate division CSSED10-310 bacterium]
MNSAGISSRSIEKFHRCYDRLCSGQTGLIGRDAIEPVLDVPDAGLLSGYTESGRRALPCTVVIKLNGGLGTSMGMGRAKSLLRIKNGMTFLDVIACQIRHLRSVSGSGLPVLFMNSTNTRQDTLEYLGKYPDLGTDIPLDFLQSRVPKIRCRDLTPVSYPSDPDLEWYPPGHGDIYDSLAETGLLDRLLSGRYQYAFVSNSDNLGACLDMEILGYFAEGGYPFMMEVADRTPADRKGGHLARSRRGGGLMLREVAQCPPEEMNEFQDIELFRYFNTNTIWLNLESLAALTSEHPYVELPLIRNKKPVNPQDLDSEPVYQLETAMGAALSLFDGATAIRVPRNRFLPVKTCQDLIGLWSDAYVLNPDFTLSMHPDRSRPVITILDQTYYKMIDQVRERFPHGAPSLRECGRWRVRGDVSFGAGIMIRGDVTIINDHPDGAKIPDGTVFDGGEYRI